MPRPTLSLLGWATVSLFSAACENQVERCRGDDCPGSGGAKASTSVASAHASSNASTTGTGATSTDATSTDASSSGAGGAPEPSLPPCFSKATDDFSDPDASAIRWADSHQAAFSGGVATVGTDAIDLGFLALSADTPATCFVSFRVGEIEDGAAAYFLLSPPFVDDRFIDADIEITDHSVSLYTRGAPSVDPDPVERSGDRYLLFVGDGFATLFEAAADEASWAHVIDIPLPPFSTLQRKMRFVKYDDLPSFTIDDVNTLPLALLETFPPAP